MNSIFESNDFWGIIICTLGAVIIYCLEKPFLQNKLESEKDFKKFVEENGSSPKMEYNLKKFAMKMAEARHKCLTPSKWLFIFGALLALYRLVF